MRWRTAFASSLVAALVLGSGVWFMREHLVDGQRAATRDQAEQQVQAILTATVANFRLGGDYGPLPYELVGGDGVLVSSSGALSRYESGRVPVMPAPGFGGSEPLYRNWTHTFRDAGADDDLSGRTVTAVDGTFGAEQVQADATGDRPGGVPASARYRVYVFMTSAAVDAATTRIDPFLWAGLPAAVLLVGVTAAWAVGRSLRPVETIRARTAAVTARDPRERVEVPATGDEIEALASTINGTLQRLDDAAQNQRRFVADAAHELRSPLTILRAGLEIAQAYPASADWPATVDQAARSTERLQGLVDDLLLLARLDAGGFVSPATVDVHALCVDLVDEYGAHRDHVSVAVTPAARPAAVTGDRRQLRRLLRNLVDNAVRHASSQVEVTVQVDTDVVRVDVHDDGVGIPAQQREAVFARFTRLDDARTRDIGGSGLGLAIARDVATAHGGTLTIVDDAPGVTLRCLLPATSAALD